MGISLDEVRRVAALAHLEFEPQDLERYAEQLSTILDYVARLQEVDTAAVETDPGSPAGKPELRRDDPVPCLAIEDTLANAPDPGQGHFRVPRVIG
jgi:aspartyl-tRNA(Asn)/glutamyl-tRNA(Gln) amidotransferase subunit C